jgi:hypothetical protein
MKDKFRLRLFSFFHLAEGANTESHSTKRNLNNILIALPKKRDPRLRGTAFLSSGQLSASGTNQRRR